MQDITDPIAEAGPEDTISCDIPNVDLDGSASSGTSITYTWKNPSGDTISINPTVVNTSTPGIYTLIITETTNGCTAIDNVTIVPALGLPIADAGTPKTITCDDPMVTISGNNSSTGPNFTYEWFDSNGFVDTSVNLSVSNPDSFILIVTNTDNGCTTQDYVIVDEDTQFPVANAGPDTLLTCSETTVPLDGNGSSMGGIYSYRWIVDTILVGTGTSVFVGSPGTFVLSVENVLNGCVSTDTVVVNQDINAPLASVVFPDTLTCAIQDIVLDGNGSSAGTQYSYEWSFNSAPLGTAITQNADQPGAYKLVVTNSDNGCTEQEAEVERHTKYRYRLCRLHWLMTH